MGNITSSNIDLLIHCVVLDLMNHFYDFVMFEMLEMYNINKIFACFQSHYISENLSSSEDKKQMLNELM